jgi:hypothetical protein
MPPVIDEPDVEQDYENSPVDFRDSESDKKEGKPKRPKYVVTLFLDYLIEL